MVSESFKILHVNVQSLSNKMINMEFLFEEERPHIASIVEHWCNSDKLQYLSINGYIQAASFCRETYIHGGAVIYARNDLQVKDVGISKFSVEKQFEFCGVKVTLREYSYCVISVYRVPDGDFFQFLERFTFVLHHCNKLADIIFVCGDLNVNYFNQSCTRKQLLDDLFYCFDLRVTSMEPTRVLTNVNNLTSVSKIDYILANTNINFKSKVFDGHFGDHRVLMLEHLTGVINVKKSVCVGQKCIASVFKQLGRLFIIHEFRQFIFTLRHCYVYFLHK